jgi:hypothetical protein
MHEADFYEEQYGHQETQHVQAVAVREESPKFDVQVRVKRAPPAPPSPMSSDTESIAASRVDRNNLSTIMESQEDRESVQTFDSLQGDVAHSHFTYVPELHPAPKYVQQPPVFSKILRKQQQIVSLISAWTSEYE